MIFKILVLFRYFVFLPVSLSWAPNTEISMCLIIYVKSNHRHLNTVVFEFSATLMLDVSDFTYKAYHEFLNS